MAGEKYHTDHIFDPYPSVEKSKRQMTNIVSLINGCVLSSLLKGNRVKENLIIVQGHNRNKTSIDS